MKVLITSYRCDIITGYLSVWAERFARGIEDKCDVVMLRDEKANKDELDNAIKDGVDCLFVNGHGSEKAICGCANEILIDEENVEILRGVKVHALSCETAKKLGKTAVASGAECYVGYREKFVLVSRGHIGMTDEEMIDDEIAGLFLEAAFTVPTKMVMGADADEAVVVAKKAYRKNMQTVLESDMSEDRKQWLLKELLWDCDSLVKC